VLGYPDKKAPMRYINRLLAMIGVRLVAKQIREGPERIWSYQYQPEATMRLTRKGAERVCSLPENWDVLAELIAARLSQKVEDLKLAELLEQQGFEVVTDEAINKQIQQSSVTEPTPKDATEETAVEEAWGWVKVWGKWVAAKVIGWCEEGTRYRVLYETAGSWSEMLAFPNQMRWGPTFSDQV